MRDEVRQSARRSRGIRVARSSKQRSGAGGLRVPYSECCLSLRVLICDSPVSVVAGESPWGGALSRYIGSCATFFPFVSELPLQRAFGTLSNRSDLPLKVSRNCRLTWELWLELQQYRIDNRHPPSRSRCIGRLCREVCAEKSIVGYVLRI